MYSTTLKIQVSQTDIDRLRDELAVTENTQLTPLFMRFSEFDQMIYLERQDAKNLVSLFDLNKTTEIATYLEINANEEERTPAISAENEVTNS